MNALLVALLLTQPIYRHQDGGIAIIDVERAAILVPGGVAEVDRVVHVDGGSWVSTEQRIYEGQRNRELAARNRYLEEHAGDVPAVMIGGAALAGAVAILVLLVATGHVK